MMAKTLLFIIVLQIAITFNDAYAASLFDAIGKMEGKTIIYGGEFEVLICPKYGKYDCHKWPIELLQAKQKEICFSTDLPCSFFCRGFIAVGQDKKPKVYLIENLTGELKEGSFEPYDCPE